MKKLTILFLFISHFSIAQSSSINEIINKIEIQEDTIKSVYDWLVDNIRYDVALLNQAKNGTKPVQKGNFKNEEERNQAKLEKVIKRKKGVCQDYSLLFDAILSQLGYKSHIISGYTKDRNGKIERKLGHAWNAVKVNGVWKLYDTTWGAGTVKDNSRFVKKYNAKWYDISAEEMLKTHLPFDPIWQLSDTPISYQAFENNENIVQSNDNYNFKNLIEIHFTKEKKEQLKDQLKRSQEMGSGIKLVDKWRNHISKKIDLFDIHRQPQLLKETNKKSIESVDLFNKYIIAKNKNFKGKKWTLEYSKKTLLKIKDQMTAVNSTYKSIEVQDSKLKRSINKSIAHSDKMLVRINSELKFINDKIK